MNFVLSSGDQVEIITTDKKRVKIEWLDFVATAKAKTAIKDAILDGVITNQPDEAYAFMLKRGEEMGLKVKKVIVAGRNADQGIQGDDR